MWIHSVDKRIEATPTSPRIILPPSSSASFTRTASTCSRPAGRPLARGNYYWQDEFYTRIFNTGNDTVEEWDVWNATLTLYSAERRWFAELWGRNFLDDNHITGQYLGDQN